MATYVDRVLEPGESVRYRTTVSWIVYISVGGARGYRVGGSARRRKLSR
jgi:hypothetical protein